jgi:hypothetical protein
MFVVQGRGLDHALILGVAKEETQVPHTEAVEFTVQAPVEPPASGQRSLSARGGGLS